MGEFLERRHKTLLALTKLVEIAGWILCITIIFLPLGLWMVLYSQTVLVQVQTENNTRKALSILERIASRTGPSGASSALMGVADSDAAEADVVPSKGVSSALKQAVGGAQATGAPQVDAPAIGTESASAHGAIVDNTCSACVYLGKRAGLSVCGKFSEAIPTPTEHTCGSYSAK